MASTTHQPTGSPPADALQLRDWHLPEPVTWWPPAPGWWILAAIFLIVLGILLHTGWQRHRNRASTRAALRELAALHLVLGLDGDVRRFAVNVSQLLRRLALTRFPATQVAGLTGQAWLDFLATTGAGEAMAQESGRLLIEAAYRADGAAPDGDPEQLHQLAKKWIQAKHRAAPVRPTARR